MKYECKIKGFFPKPNAFGVQGFCPFWDKLIKKCTGSIVCSEAIGSNAWKQRQKCQKNMDMN